jgi:2-polyprenyl-3-methyl-5-hydroxy-6-metoxy-1,4-benzoquinol methylase
MNAIVAQYIEEEKQIKLEDKKPEFESLFKLVKRFKGINHTTKVLEVGVGSGWFQIFSKREGISCRGLEINPQLAGYAQQSGRKHGVKLDIEIGNIEEADIGTLEYDVIVACSTFEHVENWQKGLRRIFNALKPGGLLYFYSTNKFSFKSGEYDFPLYDWLPNSWRYGLRKARQGESIMEWGIDFNQFTYFQLRRFFKHLGFSLVLDWIDILDPDNLNHPTLRKKVALKILKSFKPLKHLFLFFSSGTLFICIK